MAQDPNAGAASLRRAVERSTSKSGGRAAGFLVLALIAAAACAVLVMQYLDEHASAAAAPTIAVVVATLDMPLGTSLSPESTLVVQWPQDNVPDGSYRDAVEIEGRVVIAKIYKGEPITARRLAVPGAGTGLAAVLPPGFLAVSVRVDDVVGVAGFVHPGDNVDIIVTMQSKSQDDPVSKFILHNIKVLAVGKQLDRQEGTKARNPISATVATLMVDPDQAERLALAAARGQLLLALRSSLDEEVIETSGIAPALLLSGFKRPTTTIRRVLVQPKEEAKEETVEVMRGDKFEQRTFQDR